MALVTVTAANVRKDTTKGTIRGLSSVAITAGQLCYQVDATANTWAPYDADATGNLTQLVLAFALNSAPGASQPVELQNESGASYTVGGTLVAGTEYWASSTVGQIQDAAPTTGAAAVFCGVATSAALLTLAIKNFGVASV